MDIKEIEMKEYNEQVVETLDDAGCIIANKNIIIDNFQARIAELEAENERLKHNLAVTEQTMREYQELAAKRMEEIAKYRDAPVVAYLYKYNNWFGDEIWTTYSDWGGRTPLESRPLIVKPGEEK